MGVLLAHRQPVNRLLQVVRKSRILGSSIVLRNAAVSIVALSVLVSSVVDTDQQSISGTAQRTLTAVQLGYKSNQPSHTTESCQEHLSDGLRPWRKMKGLLQKDEFLIIYYLPEN